MPTVPHSAPLAGAANSVDMTFIDKPGRAELSMRHVLFAPCLYHTIWYYVTAECGAVGHDTELELGPAVHCVFVPSLLELA